MKFDLTILAALAVALTGTPGRAATQNAGDRATALDAEARAEESQGHFDIAIQKYQAIVKQYPRLPAAYNNLGRLYYQQGRFQDAIDPLKRAAELDPKLEAPHAQLGFCFFQLGDFADSRREFQTALKLSPNDG